MTRVVLDTDIWSEILRGRDAVVVARARAYVAALGRYTLSAITVMEVVYGFLRKAQEARLAQFLGALGRAEVLALDATSAELAGRIRSDLEHGGTPLKIEDILIAAIALHHGVPLATGNTKHFARIQDVGYPLVLQNWREASTR
jgi:predicted nucleic acid-binding protein